MTAGEQEDLNRAFNESFEELDESHEFGTNNPHDNILAGSEYDGIRETIANRIEVPISIPQELVTVTDTNRPHNRADDSTESVTGARQATIGEICTFESVQWAENIIKMTSSNPGSTLTMVTNCILTSISTHDYFSCSIFWLKLLNDMSQSILLNSKCVVYS